MTERADVWAIELPVEMPADVDLAITSVWLNRSWAAIEMFHAIVEAATSAPAAHLRQPVAVRRAIEDTFGRATWSTDEMYQAVRQALDQPIEFESVLRAIEN